MEMTKVYAVGWIYDKIRAQKEKKLFAEGWRVKSLEFYRSRDWTSTCCLAIIFLPLAIFASSEKVKVVYEK